MAEEVEETVAEEAADDDEVKGMDDEREARVSRTPEDPGAPTAAEIELHRVTHLPFRPWCAECVIAQGKIPLTIALRNKSGSWPKFALTTCS